MLAWFSSLRSVPDAGRSAGAGVEVSESHYSTRMSFTTSNLQSPCFFALEGETDELQYIVTRSERMGFLSCTQMLYVYIYMWGRAQQYVFFLLLFCWPGTCPVPTTKNDIIFFAWVIRNIYIKLFCFIDHMMEKSCIAWIKQLTVHYA